MNDLRTDYPCATKTAIGTVAGGFCTAANDQICETLHTTYERGFYDATYERREYVQEYLDNGIWE